MRKRKAKASCHIWKPAKLLTVEKIYGDQHFTEPPPRYSEASLVKVLEEYGIAALQPMPRLSARCKTVNYVS